MNIDNYNLISKFYSSVGDISVLSSDDERDLFLKLDASSGSEREKIIKNIVSHNLKLVEKVAVKYEYICDAVFTFEDLFMGGVEGLCCAIEKFDVSRGYKFSTYAIPWVKRQIILTINENRKLSSSEFFFIKLTKCKNFVKDYVQKNGVRPSVLEISCGTGYKVDEIEKIMTYDNFQFVNLDDYVSDDKNIVFNDVIVDTSVDVEEQVFSKYQEKAFIDFLKNSELTNQEIKIFLNYYNLYGYKKYNQAELGKIYGVTPQNISLKIQKVKKKLANSSIVKENFNINF